MRNCFESRIVPERKNPFLPGSWQREIYMPCAIDFPRESRRGQEEKEK